MSNNSFRMCSTFKLYFDHETFEQLKRLYEQVVPDHATDRWNLSVDNLRYRILDLEDDHTAKQDFLEQFNRALTQMTLQPLVPAEQTTYLIW
jgi:ABC-type transporter lipoprotein component MlaA